MVKMVEELKENSNISILIADDDDEIISLLEMCLKRNNYNVVAKSNGEAALKEIRKNRYDLVILDVMMPKKDGIEVCRAIKSDNITKYLPVIMITANEDYKVMMSCFDAGADEYILKPFTEFEVLIRVKAMLRIKSLRDELLEVNKKPENKILRKIEELKTKYIKAVKSIVGIVEQKNLNTSQHSDLVTKYSVAIATEMGLGESEVEEIRLAAEFHDVGKIAVSDFIIGKKEKLSDKEWQEVKKHSSFSVRILKPFFNVSDIKDIIEQHHERYDGSGYPFRKRGEEIPLGARIIAVADAYESMLSDKTYRETLTAEEVMEELLSNAGKQFDPKVIDAFLRVLNKGIG